MIPNITKGKKMYGLVSYLLGPGRANEHTDQHIVGGSSAILFEHAGIDFTVGDTKASVGELVRDLDAPYRLLEEKKDRPHVFHCSLSVASTEGDLSDEKWQSIAESFVTEMGFVDGTKPDCEWVAIRHGKSKNENDHVHVAVNLVRPDGTRATTHNDQPRAQQAARRIERQYGLDELKTDRSRAGWKRGEWEKAQREGRDDPERVALRRMVRNAATVAENEGDFVRRLRASGAVVKPYFSKDDRSKIVGYKAGLRPRKGQKMIMFGDKKALGGDLRLDQLRNRWEETEQTRAEAVDEWNAAYEGKATVHRGHKEWRFYKESSNQRHRTPSYDDIIDALKNLSGSNDQRGWEESASDFSAGFNEWAEHEDDPRTARNLREVADTFADSAGHATRPRSSVPSVQKPNSGYWISMMAIARNPNGRAARMAILKQMLNTTEALFDAEKARGDYRRARNLNSMANHQLAEVIKRESRYVSKLQPAGRATASQVGSEVTQTMNNWKTRGGPSTAPGGPARVQRPWSTDQSRDNSPER
ncbi:relaxase/mobilization nuclease domain-containing protein [Kocuria sp. HSID16901]|uniref:relaxase/mobilization nuclease domain-containing protein n=1 Tax=Kocuria sp. HSID16901 TaxID=2419505 RepID=UPI000F882185|nr:relaxase/mobilization nuclease domain-containing protein [Kocuria sp. HSID16901]RUQ19821.1 hypothetical protein D8M21_10895 [Kocuria sp. HSID16901]